MKLFYEANDDNQQLEIHADSIGEIGVFIYRLLKATDIDIDHMHKLLKKVEELDDGYIAFNKKID